MTTPRLTRTQWGAVPVSPTRPTRVSSTEGTAVHWLGPGAWPPTKPRDHARCTPMLRGIQRSHMAGEWYDIAYNEAVCPHGFRYELRGHHVQTGANGSDEGNARWYAVLALVGKGDPLTPQLIVGLRDAFADYRRNAGAGGATSSHRILLRQYTGKTTECPGDTLYGIERSGEFRKPTAPPTTIWKAPTMKPVLIQVSGQDAVWLSADRVTRRWVRDPKDLATIRKDMAAVGAPTTIRTVTAAQLDHYGVPVGPTPKGA